MLTNLTKTIKFNKLNKNHGWLSIWSPHGINYRNNLWSNCAHAWYGTRFSKKPCMIKIGARMVSYYKNKEIENQNENLLLEILLEILHAKLKTHPILKIYLLETNNSELLFTTSKHEITEQKWLGFCEETNFGENHLGKLWMKIRETIKKN